MLNRTVNLRKEVPTVVSTLVLLWGVFFTGLVYMLYKTEMKAEELSSTNDAKYSAAFKD